MTSRPADRTALRLEENRLAPPSQQVIARPASGPARRHTAAPAAPSRRPGAGRRAAAGGAACPSGPRSRPACPARWRPAAAGRRQVNGGGLAQRGQAALGAQRGLVEEHRVDALDPGGVPAAQVVVGLQQRPALQDVRRRDPAPRQPALLQQHPKMPGGSTRRCRESVLSSPNNASRVARLACRSRSRALQEHPGPTPADVENRQRGEGGRLVKARMSGFCGDQVDEKAPTI